METTKPNLRITATDSRLYEDKRFVVVLQTHYCKVCAMCRCAIWPTHYFPRGVRVEDVEAQHQVTHGHEGNDLCDKCQAKVEAQHQADMKSYYAAQGVDVTKLDEILTESPWSAKDPSITHDTEYDY